MFNLGKMFYPPHKDKIMNYMSSEYIKIYEEKISCEYTNFKMGKFRTENFKRMVDSVIQLTKCRLKCKKSNYYSDSLGNKIKNISKYVEKLEYAKNSGDIMVLMEDFEKMIKSHKNYFSRSSSDSSDYFEGDYDKIHEVMADIRHKAHDTEPNRHNDIELTNFSKNIESKKNRYPEKVSSSPLIFSLADQEKDALKNTSEVSANPSD
ncbi:hypothetical protein L3V82_04230 [Thiotrichales bacterium 19S3-7]|nr:hypothetical protein [Thiotrichales bacterium 19S3-7]MCF6802679.1 hypothetical protein [Thiotrichales bacterium 19S3-11]